MTSAGELLAGDHKTPKPPTLKVLCEADQATPEYRMTFQALYFPVKYYHIRFSFDRLSMIE